MTHITTSINQTAVPELHKSKPQTVLSGLQCSHVAYCPSWVYLSLVCIIASLWIKLSCYFSNLCEPLFPALWIRCQEPWNKWLLPPIRIVNNETPEFIPPLKKTLKAVALTNFLITQCYQCRIKFLFQTAWEILTCFTISNILVLYQDGIDFSILFFRILNDLAIFENNADSQK